MIEDSLSDADLIQIYLDQVKSADFVVHATESLSEAREVLSRESFDVALVDLSLPDSFGIDTCRRIREAAPSLAIIVLTGLDDEESALDAMQSGAQDYLVKDQIDGNLLSRGIRYSIERQKSRERQRQADERLRLITEQLPAVLWTTDMELRISAPSTKFLIDDGDSKSVVGISLTNYFGTEDVSFAPIEAHHRAAKGESVSLDLHWHGRTLALHVEPLRDAGNSIIGTIGISLDVSNQKRMEDELNAARHVQQALFPDKAPELDGFDIAGAVYPAEETAGDYFDFITMENDCCGLVVGDVTGHGLGPALLMAELRAYLRAVAVTRPDPGEILSLANMFLSGDLEDHRFVTLFFARLDPVNRTLSYASAGHSAYLLRASGEIETLKSTGLPLGLIPDTTIDSSFDLTIAEGDILLMPTDGFQEAHTSTNELFGLDAVLEFVQKRKELPSAQIIEALRDEVCDFIGSRNVADDMSAVIVRCLPNAS